jgi:hypothetical protein
MANFVCIFFSTDRRRLTPTRTHDSEKLAFVVGDGEEAGGLWVLLMVIFGIFVNFFFGHFC